MKLTETIALIFACALLAFSLMFFYYRVVRDELSQPDLTPIVESIKELQAQIRAIKGSICLKECEEDIFAPEYDRYACYRQCMAE